MLDLDLARGADPGPDLVPSPECLDHHRGVLDTDLLLTRTVRPLRRPVDAMLTVLGARPEGADSTLNIR